MNVHKTLNGTEFLFRHATAATAVQCLVKHRLYKKLLSKRKIVNKFFFAISQLIFISYLTVVLAIHVF